MAQQFSRNLSLTSDLSTIAFGFRPTYIRIDATTAGTAFLSFNTTIVATTNSSADSASWQFTSGAPPLVISAIGVERNGLTSQFTAIALAGSTSVLRILAVRI